MGPLGPVLGGRLREGPQAPWGLRVGPEGGRSGVGGDQQGSGDGSPGSQGAAAIVRRVPQGLSESKGEGALEDAMTVPWGLWGQPQVGALQYLWEERGF